MSACWEQNRATPADLVDHVVPHRGDPSLFWDELNNWQSLCSSCHARKTAAGA
jgi:5-methylcytosine-specific restriction protein A